MPRKLDLLFDALEQARQIIGHSEYVIVGSLSAIAHEISGSLPPEMAISNDFDMYTKADPGRIYEVVKALGEGSPFYDENDAFIDPVSPRLLTLPSGWEERMRLIERNGIKAFFLEANDAAVSKYTRGAPNDARWIQAGIRAGLIDLDVVTKRLSLTRFLDDDESRATRQRVASDRKNFKP